MKKIKFGLISILLLIAFRAGAQCTIVLTSPAGSDQQIVCVNTAIEVITYATTGANGATFNNLPAGVTGSWDADVVTISGTPSVAGTYNYSVRLTSCGSVSMDGTITVHPDNTITLSSAIGSNSQTVCQGSAIANITYNTTDATDASFSGLPEGVTGTWNSNVVTISGTPTAGSGTYSYTVSLLGGCGNISASGSIKVATSNTIVLTSSSDSDNQTACTGTAITNITYSTTGATGATFSGLPPGVSGSWSSNVVTISGTPNSSSGSPYNYTVSLTGGCGTISANGTINVTPLNTITLSSPAGTTSQSVCAGTAITPITYITTGATGATFSGLPSGVSGSWSSNAITISGTPASASGSPFNYIITLTGGCGSVTSAGTINVITGNTITLSSPSSTANQSVCTGNAITNITYSTTGATGATFSGLPAGVTGSWSSNVVTISGSPSSASGSPYGYTVTLTGGCGTANANGVITVLTGNTITLTSGSETNNQTTCSGNAITHITYSTTGATGATFSGLPAGVTGSWSSNVVTISGTPSSSSGSPFNYTVTLTGGCGSAAANGTIIVTPGNTITLSSAEGTNNQSTCINTAITSITYATTGATGATFSGLPSGVTGVWSANTVTISGVPSSSGIFNYSVNLTGGCGAVSANGTISVNALPVPTLTSSEPDHTICAGTNVTFTATGGVNYNFLVNGVSRQNGSSPTFITSTLTNGQRIRALVTNSSNCSALSPEIQIIVNPVPFISLYSPTTCSTDFSTYSFSVIVSSGTVTSTSGNVSSAGSNIWTISGITAGTSVIISVTSGGCINTLNVTAPDCSCPAISAPVSGGDQSFCENGVVPQLSASVPAGQTVDWYDAASGGTLLRSASLTYTPATAGTFYAVARNTTSGCISSTRTAIIVSTNPAPVAVISSSDADNSFCGGTSITFTAGGGSNYDFRVAGSSVQNSAQNTYITSTLTNNQVVDVIVTNSNGCSATSSGITNIVHPQPVPALSGSDADNSFCTGTNITFTAAGGSSYNFRIDGVSVQDGSLNTYSTNSLTNGQVVDVIVTNSNGCTATATPITNAVFDVPVISAGTGGNNCGLSFHFNGTMSAGTGRWTKESGPGNTTFVPDANAPNATVSVSTYGSYIFRWTVLNGTCEASETVAVVFIQQSAANAGTGGDECDLNFTFNALPITSGVGTWTMINGPGTITLTPDNHTPNATVAVSQAGTYDFAWTVVNSTCTSSDIIRVGFHGAPPVNAGRDTAMCKGGTLQLTATGSGSFSWTPVTHINNPSIINPIVNPDVTTTYTANLTDQFGCINSDDVIVEVRTNPVANAGPDQTLVLTFSASLDAVPPGNAESGTWEVISGTGVLSDNTYAQTSVDNLSPGENKFVWTVSNGVCPISHDTSNIYINDFVIPTLITPNMDGRNDYFKLNGLSAAGQTELLIFDRRGVEVYSNSNYDNSWDGVDFNNNPLPEDTYFYSLKTATGKTLKGFIVIKR